ncbi:zona pellucida sperm-binding protein 3 isoform X3 [Oryzias melastigma]|uniref:zona pellucida sperm-binding protein 3 isoform X3 n=1 Tax=Oryzias melastigma TaxID=30732 RepID=UPI000CF804BA|nr:zona pellucida sperm-binding protein 3 isoform X3 [Oryzias melastigma]
MAPSRFKISCLYGHLTAFCLQLTLAFPPLHYMPAASPQDLRTLKSQSSLQSAVQQPEEPVQVNTVDVLCHPDSMELRINADLFAVGAPVDVQELRLGVEHSDYCSATAASDSEYRILVGLEDCGTKHWMTEDSLVYTNLLIYTPLPSLNGVTRMDEAVVPVECQYKRKYSLSSSSLMPTWVPFTSTQAAVETLQFNLRLMTNDWLHERGANTFFLGEPINIEASVRVDHHMGLRLFLTSCVATLEPDIKSDPKYIFIENGCLLDSQLPGSKAHFLPRTRDDKLQLTIDSFKFHNDERGQLYITCHLNAVPVDDAEALNKACTFVNGRKVYTFSNCKTTGWSDWISFRWRSADGNDYLCGFCQSPNDASKTLSIPGIFNPRSFVKSADMEPLWRSGLKTNQVWEHDARVGPMTIMPSWKGGALAAHELPPVLHKIHKTALYGSHWRSGIHGIEKSLVPEPSTSKLEEDDNYDDESDSDLDFVMKSLEMARTNNTFPIIQYELEHTVTNATASKPDLSDKHDPKK